MKRSLFSCLLILALCADAQNLRSPLASTIGRADSIVLISHGTLRGVGADQRSMPLSLLEGNQQNPAGYASEKKLSSDLVDSLAIHLTAQYEFDATVAPALCFDPHQAILIYKDGAVSYIDLCFHCLNYSASADLAGMLKGNLGERKWGGRGVLSSAWVELGSYCLNQDFQDNRAKRSLRARKNEERSFDEALDYQDCVVLVAFLILYGLRFEVIV